MTERNGGIILLKGSWSGDRQTFYRVGKDGHDVLLFDVEKYQEGNTFTLSSWIAVSDNGNMIMLGITESGKGNLAYQGYATCRDKTFILCRLTTLFFRLAQRQ
ncbi:MAG: hypothetical protein R3A12_19120 [Ignavibacteria bacterium]